MVLGCPNLVLPGVSVTGPILVFFWSSKHEISKSRRPQTMPRLTYGFESGLLQSIAGVFGVFWVVLGAIVDPGCGLLVPVHPPRAQP